MIVCPRCSYENEDSATNCASCRINLQWALENLQEEAQHNLERVEEPPPEVQAGNRAVRGFLLIVLLLAIPASAVLAFVNLLSYGYTPDSKEQLRSGYMIGAGFWLVVAVVCLLVAIAMLLSRPLRPRFLRGLRILALIGVTGGLLFGLMRLTLVILPEHSGRSLTIQYKLGERDFSGVNLEQANLTGARLREADLSGADLQGADLTGANLYQTDLSGADLGGADLSGTSLSNTDLRGADLRGANLHQANLHETVFDDATQIEARWRLVNEILTRGARDRDLSGADLREAYLYHADLREAGLRGADLRGADLRWADLRGADLREADLTGAYLREANLREADLRDTDLRKVDLTGAYLGEANLTGAYVTGEQLDRAWDLTGTILPDGLVHE